MTLPCSRFPRLDSVAVGATDNALVAGDLCLNGGNGLERRDVRRLAFHMVDVESCGMGAISTVDASGRHFEVGDPRLHRTRPLIRDHVVSRLGLGVGNPLPVVAPTCVGIIGAFRARPACAQRRAVFGRAPFRRERLSALRASPLGGRRVLPGRHTPMIPVDDRDPCKPDIFEATYERMGVRDE